MRRGSTERRHFLNSTLACLLFNRETGAMTASEIAGHVGGTARQVSGVMGWLCYYNQVEAIRDGGPYLRYRITESGKERLKNGE